jgi:AraC family transcriptional regulator of adaptative response / DNA-3-methyladenine glycosylase II
LFDLDANPLLIDEHLAADPLLARSVVSHRGLRIPGTWDVFELAVRAVLGQQVSVAGATTLAGRFAKRFGTSLETPVPGLHLLAAQAVTLAAATVEAIASIGLPRSRAACLQALAAAEQQGGLSFGPLATMEEVVSRLRTIRGIGEWTAQYIAMRALRFPDAFPAADLGVRKALAQGQGSLPSEREVLNRASRWSPWRGYATFHLWQMLEDASSPAASD